MKTQLLSVQSFESGFLLRARSGSVVVGSSAFGLTVAPAMSASTMPVSYAGTAGIAMAETSEAATHAIGLACSPCPVAKKQDRKNNWHGRPLIGRGGIG
jgi:hypothetical protein